MANSNLPCSQNAFVSATSLCIDLLSEHATDLMSVKPKYTVPFFEALRSDLQAADLMPDDKTRRALAADALLVSDADRAALVKLILFFKSYITDTFEKSRWENVYAQAGFDYFTKAKNGDWTSMTGFISSAIPFLEDNKTALMSNDTMPPTFIADFNAAVTKTKASYNAWLALSKGMSKADAKVEAFNAVNTTLSAALKVANVFYADSNPALAHQFTFTAQLSQVQGTKNAGINGKVLNADKKAIPNLVVTIQGSDKTSGCDKDGRYEITPLSMGKYTVIFTAPGYVTQVFKDEIVKTGVMTRVNVEMKSDE
jgi:Carboxypeptidase regulatory-like domain